MREAIHKRHAPIRTAANIALHILHKLMPILWRSHGPQGRRCIYNACIKAAVPKLPTIFHDCHELGAEVSQNGFIQVSSLRSYSMQYTPLPARFFCQDTELFHALCINTPRQAQCLRQLCLRVKVKSVWTCLCSIPKGLPNNGVFRLPLQRINHLI